MSENSEPTENIGTELSVVNKYGAVSTQISNKDLRAQIEFETERREILKQYIKDHLVRNYDYGKIHIAKDCANKFNCKITGHFSKYTLFKPGQEKVMSLLHWISDFKVDHETRDLFREDAGVVPYICIIYDMAGKFVAQGKGAAILQECYGSHNNCIKKAKKRSQADALLSSGVLSDFLSLVEDEGSQGTEISVPSNGCTCATKSKWHSKTCPLWQDPAISESEIAEGEVLTEDVDPDSLPKDI